MHIFGFLAEIVMPSLQQSSLLLGCLHFTSGLHIGSQGGGQTGGQAGAHTGAQTGLHGSIGGQTGLHGAGTAHTGWHGCSQADGAQSVVEPEHPTHIRAVVHKKINEAIFPSCFLIFGLLI
jgi:hypothetical protein